MLCGKAVPDQVAKAFDTYQEDLSVLLKIEDDRKIGKAIRTGSEMCSWRRFSVLLGWYHPDLRRCVRSFVEGLG